MLCGVPVWRNARLSRSRGWPVAAFSMTVSALADQSLAVLLKLFMEIPPTIPMRRAAAFTGPLARFERRLRGPAAASREDRGRTVLIQVSRMCALYGS